MNKKMSKRQKDLKSKLMAAICMLLVSSIMMVSTTYAWFTLSTAPEVTGITTAVGANGNLEMALLPEDGDLLKINSQAGDSVKDAIDRNVTWGNLVDLSDSSVYGLDKITLYPSALNLTDAGNVNTAAGMLSTPAYGADGRVSQLVANTVAGIFNTQTKNFTPDTGYGVRAVGNASGMTDRQLAYRNARAAANTSMTLAKNLASQSLQTNGGELAKIAILHAAGNDDGAYKQENVAAMRAIVSALEADGGVLDQIETAYKQYILAYAASGDVENEDAWNAVSGAISAGDTLSELTAVAGSVPDALNDALTDYNAMVTSVSQASAAVKALEDQGSGASFNWNAISTPLRYLCNPDVLVINDYPIDEVKDHLSSLFNGVVVKMPSGGGIYADIADHCGDYSASVTVRNVSYGGMNLEELTAKMETDTSMDSPYLVAIGTVVNSAGAPGGTGTADLPISDMYGYIIDMAFRTNAAESNLLLQIDPVDRIYEDQKTGSSVSENDTVTTMGHGSTMTFMATTDDLSEAQVKELMRAIRIVFFDTTTGAVKSYAKLDVDAATFGTDGWTAKMYLYTETAAGTSETYTPATAEQIANAKLDDATVVLYTQNQMGEGGETTYAEVTDKSTIQDSGVTYFVKTTSTTAAGENRKTDGAIMALSQNTPVALSCLVYLDGNNVGNDDVAATAATSMTGTMNLQFASSANLVPMEYASLHQFAGSGNTNGGTGTEETETAITNFESVAGETGVTATAKQIGTNVVIQMTGYNADNHTAAVEIGGAAQTATPDATGKITIAAPADFAAATTAVKLTVSAKTGG